MDTKRTSAGDMRSTTSSGGNTIGSTYHATIRTPVDTKGLSTGMNASLTALEGEEDIKKDGMGSNFSERAKHLANSAIESMQEIKHTLKGRASHLGEQLSEITGTTKERLLNETTRLTNRVKNFDYEHALNDTRVILGRDPARTMLIAGGIGLALGFIIGRSRRR